MTGWQGGSFLDVGNLAGSSKTLNIAGSLTLRSGSASIQGRSDSNIILTGSGSITTQGGSIIIGSTSNTAGVKITGTYSLGDDFNSSTATVYVTGSGSFSVLNNFTCNEFTITGGTLTANLSGAQNFICALFSVTGSPTVTLNNTIVTCIGYKGTVLGFSSSATISAANASFQLFGTGTIGSTFPSIIDLQGKSIGFLALKYSVGFDDTYTSNQYWRFASSGTIGQLDVPAGVFMKAVASITLTVTNCNITGTSTLPCSLISETGASQFNLCVTNYNVVWTTFKDVNANCTAINDPNGSCTSNCSNITFVTPTVSNKGASVLFLM
jgi:hypothetical protein